MTPWHGQYVSWIGHHLKATNVFCLSIQDESEEVSQTWCVPWFSEESPQHQGHLAPTLAPGTPIEGSLEGRVSCPRSVCSSLQMKQPWEEGRKHWFQDHAKSMTLLWGPGSPPCWRVMIALEEKLLQGSNQKLLSFSKGDHRSKEVLDINPRAQVVYDY